MGKKSVNICKYSKEFVQNVDNILRSTNIIISKIKEGFDEHHEKFKPFLKCVEEGNLNSYIRKIKAREEGVEIKDIKLTELDKLVSDPEKSEVAKALLDDMEKTLTLVKDINFERMKEFIYRNKMVYIYSEFELYLSKCIKYILLKYPEILDEKSLKLKEIRLITSTGNLGLVNETIAEKTIHDLFYNNYLEIFKYLKNPLGLELDLNQKTISKLNGYKEIRNLLTHSDGVINLLFQTRVLNWNLNAEDLNINSFELGEKIIIDNHVISNFFKFLLDIMIEIDVLMVKKFPEVRFEVESLDHLFYSTYLKFIEDKWTNVLKKEYN